MGYLIGYYFGYQQQNPSCGNKFLQPEILLRFVQTVGFKG